MYDQRDGNSPLYSNMFFSDMACHMLNAPMRDLDD